MKNLLKLFIICFILTACSKKNKNLLTVDQLYNEGIILLKNGDYTRAGEQFELIDNDFNLNQYSNDTLMMSAYSYYKSKKYNDSLRIITYYKSKYIIQNINREYMDYLEILNIFDTIKSSYKSTDKIEKCFSLIKEFIFNYKKSIYKEDLNNKYNLILNKLVENQINLAKYFYNNNNVIGALNHLKNIENNYVDHKYKEEMYFLFCKVYAHLHLNDLYNIYIYKLNSEFTNSKWLNNL